jgi:hypothetical protein
MTIKSIALAAFIATLSTTALANNDTNKFVDYNNLLSNPTHVQKMGMLYTYADEASFYTLFDTPLGYASEVAPAPLWKSNDGKVNTAALYYAGKAGYDIAAVKVREGEFNIYAIKAGRYFGIADTHKGIADDTVLLGVILAQETNPTGETMNALK